MFKLVREPPFPPVMDRIQFQSDNELDELETAVTAIDRPKIKFENTELQSPVLQTKHPAKRKMDEVLVEIKAQNVIIKTEEPEVRSRIVTIDDDVINISDSEGNNQLKLQKIVKKPKLDSVCEELPKINMKEVTIKAERDNLEYDAFQVKQEHQVYDDDPIYIDSESEDDESVQWLMRLSQSSPGKPLIKVKESNTEIHNEDNSYSQIDDDVQFPFDLISIPSQPHEYPDSKVESCNEARDAASLVKFDDDEEDVLISLNHTANNVPTLSTNNVQIEQDNVDGMSSNYITTDVESTNMGYQQDKGKRTQMIEPLICVPRKKTIQPVIISQSKYVKYDKNVLY